jgi:hypothetical protein
MQASNLEEMKRAIELSEQLKSSLSALNKEEISSLNLYSETNYCLTNMLLDEEADRSFHLDKYMLSGHTGYDYINPRYLDKSSPLHDSLQKLIKDTMNKNFVSIYLKPKTFSFQNNDLFSLKFYNTFKLAGCGRIQGLDFQKQNDFLQLGAGNSNELDKINASVELVKKGMLCYEGNSIKDKDLLIYGADVESNRYLDFFLTKMKPKKVLNIIPYHNSPFLHDNVD